MKREAAVIGKPISHSLSPSIFGYLAHHLGISDLNYNAREVGAEELSEFVRQFRDNPQGAGFNVTIPHKETILPLLDEISPEAQTIGAVNVVQRAQGQLRGYNTDVYGIIRTFEKHQVSIEGGNVLLIGAGGAARAVAYALGLKKARHVTLLSANVNRAHALISAIAPQFSETRFDAISEWNDVPAQSWSLVVQSTPLGMKTHPTTREGVAASDYFASLRTLQFAHKAWAFDLIYRPEQTPFLDQANARGLIPIAGLDMLIAQALETWRIWFGTRPEIEMAEYLRHRPLFLTGFMGAGKSTIGPLLAQSLGWNFIETDLEIEKKTGRSIGEIFREKGESVFRELEHQTVLENAFSPRTIISLGGGALTHPSTRELLKNTGRLVFLTASAQTLNDRLRDQAAHRPLLSGLSENQRIVKIESLLKEREPFYNLAAFSLDTASLSAEQAAEKIREHFL